MTRALLVAALVCLAASARGEPVVLRMAVVAPEGTAWAREFHAVSRDVERRTEGRVRVKWYLGGIAGDENQVFERVQRGSLEGTGSGGPGCRRVMPSLRVLEVPGLFQEAGEAKYVVNQLAADLAAEAQQSGFVYLGTSPLGAGIYFGRRPVTSMAELRATRIWIWDLETTFISLAREMGLNIVPAALERAGREFDAGHSDAFWALPTAALAFQWSTEAPYLVDLRGEYLFGCVLLTNRAFALISPDDQRQLRAATAQMANRLDEVSRQQEEALLHGAFQHQGVKIVPVSDSFRAEFFAAARVARDKMAPTLLPRELLQRARGLLSDYRAEHGSGR